MLGGSLAKRAEAIISAGVSIRLPPQAELFTRQAGSRFCLAVAVLRVIFIAVHEDMWRNGRVPITCDHHSD